MPARRIPKLRRNESVNQAFVEIDRHRHYHGKRGDPRTEEAYHRDVPTSGFRVYSHWKVRY